MVALIKKIDKFLYSHRVAQEKNQVQTLLQNACGQSGGNATMLQIFKEAACQVEDAYVNNLEKCMGKVSVFDSVSCLIFAFLFFLPC